MFFKYSCEIVGLGVHLQDTADIEFHFNSPMAAVVHLGKEYPDGQQAADASSGVCVGTTAGQIEDDTCAAEVHTALTTSLDGKRPNFTGIDASRHPTVLSAVDRFFTPLRNLIESTIAILRWRAGLSEGPTDPFRNRKEYLSQDEKSWLEVGTARSLRILFARSPRQIVLSPQLESDVVDFVAGGNEEPLGHQLFREAWNQRGSHPRSALVIGVAAAEVGLKKLIGTLVPQAQWLVDELQTPSFSKMLRKYLPSLPVKGKFLGKKIIPPGSLIKKLERAVECRNKLVHAGEAPPNREELEEMLRAIDDFLWTCDVYAGHFWVGGYISTETQTAWENE